MFRKSTLLLVTLAIIFAGVYLYLATPVKTSVAIGSRFDWPDEMANYFWSEQYATSGQLAVFEPLNLVGQNQIHPRSFNVRSDGSLVPGSFLGLILFYGTLAKFFSVKAIIYFTPILAIFGILAFYGIIKRIFSEKIALISAILMFFHPAWWYYSATSMLPNVAFVSLLILGIYFLLKKSKITLFNSLISGLATGLAISIRPSEIIWVVAIYLLLFVYLRPKLKISYLALFLAIVFLIILPTLSQQQILYGSFVTSGYSQLAESQGTSCSTCQLVKSLILPFGIHPFAAALNFWTHFVSRFWWLSFLTLLGLIAFLTQKTKQKAEVFVYVLLSFFLFGWLVIYYGSWQFTDLLTVHLNTLGLSYVRYWLPLYLLALPFTAIGLIWLTNFFKNRWKNLVLIILILFLFYQSADLVLRAKPDSLLPVRNRIASYKESAAEVMDLTEEESVIITVRKDKIFFPDRKVIHTFEALTLNKEILDILPGLTDITPVYYFALGSEPTLELGNGLRLELIGNIGQEILYAIK